MKKKFSNAWSSSRQRRKQRKYTHNAPGHVMHRFLSANLSKDLRKKHSRRSLELRKGDTARIMRGEFKNKKGKIIKVDAKNARAYIEGMQRTKRDGTKINVPFKASKLQISELNLDDKERIKVTEERKK